ncbi:MAG TPA: methyltransferase domain-containing protein, partial [Thermopetrobacter sp.]|nr:methyltransferase domain-containing protein [Thermopetrobacter sp.]
ARAAGHANIELRQGRLEALPVEDACADWVFSNCVINLAADKNAVFAEIARVLKPGGRLLISDIVAEDLPDWVGMHADLYAACLSGALSPADYLRAAQEAGLHETRIVDTLRYDAAAIRQLVQEELPVALDELAGRFGLSRKEMLDKAVADLEGKITAIKLTGVKPVG